MGKTASEKGLAIRAVLGTMVLLALFFLPAGSLNWPEAWGVLGLYLLSCLAAFIWMKRNDPGLLRERISRDAKRNSKAWDNRIMIVYSTLMLTLIAVCALDRVRFGWSRLPLAVTMAAFPLFVVPGYLLFRVIRANHFLSERVRIQDDRGHTVCDTGPYAVIRHPMYAAIILFTLLLPPALGSLYGLIPAVLVALLMVLRTILEDGTLKRELPGYLEYAARIRYRLVPGIW